MVDPTFANALFREQTPGLAEAFETVLDTTGLFAASTRGKLEVYTRNCIAEYRSQQHHRDGSGGLSKAGYEVSLDRHRHRLLATQLIFDVEALEHYMSDETDLQAFFISQRNSFSLLQISHELYTALCRRRGISPQFNDYILYSGARDNEVEITPPAMRLRVYSDTTGPSCECMYGIRFVEHNALTDVPVSSKWSLRQSAIYYGRSPFYGGQSWIFVTIPEAAKRRIDAYFANCALGLDRNLLEVMVLILDTVIGNWRPYLVALYTETETHATQFLGASPDNQGPTGLADTSQRQQMMLLDDRMGNSSVAIKATEHDLRSLLEQSLQGRLAQTHDDLAILAITEKLRELESLSLKLEALRTRLAGVANLVTSFLDLSNGLALQELGQESRRENENMRALNQRMHILAEKSTQDAAAMKVLTIVGLIYLPLTVVTNIFSTSFIGVSESSNSIYVTSDWWILVAVAMPLTGLTFYAWWIWTRIKVYSTYPPWWKYLVSGPGSMRVLRREPRVEPEIPATLLRRSSTDRQC